MAEEVLASPPTETPPSAAPAIELPPIEAPDPVAVVRSRLATLQAERSTRQDALDLPRSMSQREVDQYLQATRILDAQISRLSGTLDVVEKAERATLAAQHQHQTWTAWQSFLLTLRASHIARLVQLPQRGRTRAETTLIQQLEHVIDLIDGTIQPATAYGVVALHLPASVTDALAAAGYRQQDPHGPFRLYDGWPWIGSLKEATRQLTEADAQIAQADRQLTSARRMAAYAIR